MMPLSGLDIQTTYRDGSSDIASDFYVPCMDRAVRYDRAVGFFSSSVYLLAWPALRGFVNRNGVIRVVCSPFITNNDAVAVADGYDARMQDSLRRQLQAELDTLLDTRESASPTRLLACLVASGVVEMRVALLGASREPECERLFHDKVGLFEDEGGNRVLFKGSMNETWKGLSADGNLESIDAFIDWGDSREAQRIDENQAFFESLWRNLWPGVQVVGLPEAVRRQLLTIAETTTFESELAGVLKSLEARVGGTQKANKRIRSPFPHQLAALRSWERNGRRGVLKHATGSGKTFTALMAIEESFGRREVPLVVVPSQLLLRQWKDEIRDSLPGQPAEVLVCGGGDTRWRDPGVLKAWTAPTSQRRLVLATMDTARSDAFLSRIREGQHLFLVADEVHQVGGPARQKIMSLSTGPRLGLSATPERAGDQAGTNALFAYFGDVLDPEFSLHDAIKAKRLCPYLYHPHVLVIDDDEQVAWRELTTKLQQAVARTATGSGDLPDHVKLLMIQRSRILKQAAAKIDLAAEVCREHFRRGQRWLVYCDSAGQVADVRIAIDHALRGNGTNAQVLEYHTAMSGDAASTLGLFRAAGGIVCAIKCLDEGVDIPETDHALILASSRNPREFIQRRGRVLRRSEGKSQAVIHDVLTVPQHEPDASGVDAVAFAEMARALEFAESALNPSAASLLKARLARLGYDPYELADLGVEDDADT